jgi:serine/threonine protein kinase
MGEVYRARDSRLGRDVAIKISSAKFTERFDREARAIAALNHPNICTLHDVGPDFLVMELVEGEAPKGPLPLETAISYARQIADALGAAHEKGIIHRDLKPSNIKVTPSGIVKVLDFGLARSTGTSPLIDDAPTAIGDTEAGAILGTPSYMSPEQAAGKPIDKRADVWAFGVVLYEMLTGQRPFEGDTVQEILACVIKDTPDLSKVPMRVRPLLRGCLEKDPKRRLRDIGDAMLLLQGTPAESPARRRSWIWPAIAAVFGALSVVALWAPWRSEAPSEITRFTVDSPAGSSLSTYAELSPDGRKLAFTAVDSDGRTRIWVRDLGSFASRVLPGTEIASSFGSPFWSPDSKFIAFSDGGTLKKVDVTGTTPPLTIAKTNVVLGRGAWNGEGTILIGSRVAGSPLFRIRESGGEASPVTVMEPSRSETLHGMPCFLPGGRNFIYYRESQTEEFRGFYVGSLDVKPNEQTLERLLAANSQVNCVFSSESADVRLVFIRDGSLLTQRFDSDALELVGDVVPVTQGVGSTGAPFGYGFFTASYNALVYRMGGQNHQLAWVDRQGRPLPADRVGEPGQTAFGSFSRDGNRFAVARRSPGSYDIWLLELARNVSTRLTFDPLDDVWPIWSPDGSRIAFQSVRSGTGDLYVKSLDGAETVLLATDKNKFADTWSPDGRFIIYEGNDAPGTDLWLLPMEGEKKPVPWIRSPFNEWNSRFSPDGRWVAYQSDESGRYEIYVREFITSSNGITAGPAYQVSREGGEVPQWTGNGKELIYAGLDRMMRAVDVTTTPRFTTGPAKTLFRFSADLDRAVVALHPDGQRFLMPMPVDDTASVVMAVVTNWQTALGRQE